MENVHPGIIDPNNNLGLGTYPMTSADQGPRWATRYPTSGIQGASPLKASAACEPYDGATHP